MSSNRGNDDRHSTFKWEALPKDIQGRASSAVSRGWDSVLPTLHLSALFEFSPWVSISFITRKHKRAICTLNKTKEKEPAMIRRCFLIKSTDAKARNNHSPTCSTNEMRLWEQRHAATAPSPLVSCFVGNDCGSRHPDVGLLAQPAGGSLCLDLWAHYVDTTMWPGA